ncbi:hypothetical protein CES85_0935 [Ochrobactrum quorumnocens]|uniref:Uncharacterized protein n=1 Tax=Ochrobactrum quorumnocens TaxID=271865 RepID=A0A248UK10_9HYPH|nr:hypothetical protein CES85_0935 [[Ochrobactrum] quorumnocens]
MVKTVAESTQNEMLLAPISCGDPLVQERWNFAKPPDEL